MGAYTKTQHRSLIGHGRGDASAAAHAPLITKCRAPAHGPLTAHPLPPAQDRGHAVKFLSNIETPLFCFCKSRGRFVSTFDCRHLIILVMLNLLR